VSGKKSFIFELEVETKRGGLFAKIQCISGTRLASFPCQNDRHYRTPSSPGH
jgi:hypothetical protein